MFRVLCMCLMLFLLACVVGATLRVEAYTTVPACPRFSMYEATDIGGTGFAPQVLAPSASDCNLEYVMKLPGLSVESSNMARKASKAVDKQNTQTADAAAVIKDGRIKVESDQAKADAGALY